MTKEKPLSEKAEFRAGLFTEPSDKVINVKDVALAVSRLKEYIRKDNYLEINACTQISLKIDEIFGEFK